MDASVEMSHRELVEWSFSDLRDHLRFRAEQLNVSSEIDIDVALAYLITLPSERVTAEAADALTYLARILRGEGRMNEALQAASHARHWGSAVNDVPVLHRALGTESDVLMDLGMFAEAALARVKVWSLARAMGDVLREICAIGNVGILVEGMGQWEAAASYFERARELAEKHGFAEFEFHSRSNLAGCALKLGNAESGFSMLRDFDAEEVKTRLAAELAANTHHTLARLHLLVDDVDAARLHAEKSARMASVAGIERSTCYTKLLVGMIEVRSGAHEPGLAAVVDALEFAKRVSRSDVPDLLGVCVETHEAAGDLEKALDYLHELVDWKRKSIDAALICLQDSKSTGFTLAPTSLSVLDREILAKTQSLQDVVQGRLRLLIETAINSEIALGFDLFRTFRVAKLARSLAAEIGWEEKRIELLSLGAQLCNIGMLAIPTRIVQKSHELSAGESSVFYEHTRLGAKLLRGSKLRALDIAAVIAEQHHERFDGSGFPEGLCAEHITEEARIVAVCDAFDTLTHRSLSLATPLATHEALAEIRRGAGSRFDPLIVDAFDGWIRRELPRHADFDAHLAQGAEEFEYVRARARMERLLVEA